MAAGRAPAAAGRFVETVLEAGRAPSVRAPVPFPVVRPPPPQVEEEVEDEDEDEDDDEPPMRNTYGLWAMCSLVEADITSKLAEIRGAPNDDWPAAYRELCDCVLFFRLPCVRMVFAPKPPKGSREQRTVPSGAVNIPVSMQFDNNTPNSVVTLRTPLTPSSTHPRGPKLKTYTIGDEAAKFLRKFATPFCDTVAHLHQSGAAVPEWAVRCAKDTSGTNQLNDRLYYFVLNKVSKTEGDVFPQPGDPISNENETPCCEFWPQAFPASATPKDILSTLEMKMTELNREARAGRSDVQVSKVCISHAFYNGDLDAMFEQLMPLNPFHQQPVMYRNVTKLPLELEFRSIRKRTLHLTAFEFTQPQLTADALGLISLLIYHTAINTEYVDFLQGALFLFGIHVHDTRGYRVPDTVRESTPVVRRASSRLISSASASLSTSAKRVRRDIPSDEEAPPPQHPDEPDGPDWAQQILLHQEKLQREFQEQQRRYREEQQQQQQQEVQEEVEEEMEEEVQPYQGRYQQQEQQQEAPGLDVDVLFPQMVSSSPTRQHVDMVGDLSQDVIFGQFGTSSDHEHSDHEHNGWRSFIPDSPSAFFQQPLLPLEDPMVQVHASFGASSAFPSSSFSSGAAAASAASPAKPQPKTQPPAALPPVALPPPPPPPLTRPKAASSSTAGYKRPAPVPQSPSHYLLDHAFPPLQSRIQPLSLPTPKDLISRRPAIPVPTGAPRPLQKPPQPPV